MTVHARTAFPLGWTPDADPINGPDGAVLRMDNLVLDELGVLALRAGSTKINTVALGNTDVHSLYTAVLNGTRYRMTGATAAVYANGSSIATGLAGSNDIAFGSHLGQILFARSTSKKKYDGSTVRNWGVSMTGSAPTIAAVAADFKVFASCDQSESPAFSADTLGGTITATYPTGEDGTSNGAVEVTPDATYGRVSITKTFGGDTDFTSYTGGATGTDDDLITFYVYLADPASFFSVTLGIGVNGTAFENDNYWFTFAAGTPIEVFPPDTQDPTNPTPALPVNPLVSYFQFSVGWNKLTVRRSQMNRSGSTSGKDWKTVRLVRLVAQVRAGSTGVVRFDTVQISSGLVAGTREWRYVYVYNSGTYLAKSAPSAISTKAPFTGLGATVTAPSDGSRDSQINEIWVYRRGGSLDQFYRTVVKTGVSGTGSVAITDQTSDASALTTDLLLETDNTTPPDNIIAIDGPYFDRTLTLTSDGYLYPSRRLNPDSFSTSQAVRVTGADESPYWVKKSLGGLYIGTSKDVYRLSGTGAELPDGTVDFTLEPLNIDAPPVSAAVAQDGPLLVYLAHDGWRGINGTSSSPLAGPTSLLYRGYTRHGVSPVNVTGGRFRAAIVRGQLVAITPEGSSTTSAAVLYRHVFGLSRWYRHTYPSSWRSIAREPDGTLIAGDNAGFVWILDSGTGDDSASIPMVWWTRADDAGTPLAEKSLSNVHVEADTGGSTLSIAVHLDGSDTASTTVTGSSSGMGVLINQATGLATAKYLQLRVTGSLTSGRMGGYALIVQPLPLGVKAWDSGPMDLGVNEIVWVRQLRIKVRAAAALTVQAYFDGVPATAVSVPVSANVTTSYVVPVGREFKGRVPRVVITSTGTFNPYWVEFIRRTSGAVSDKASIRVPSGVGGEVAA